MTDPFDDYNREERRGFARLLADAMRPHLQEAMAEAVEEYMGQNGKEHKADHQSIRSFLTERRDQKTAALAMSRQVRTGVMISLIVLVVQLIGGLFVYWVTTVNRAQIEEIKKEVPRISGRAR